MGAWGYGPWANDSAMDWIGRVADGIAEAISERLTPSTSPSEYDDVIGAADLLDSLTPEERPGFPEHEKVPRAKRWGRAGKEVPITLSYQAERMRLYSKAAKAIDSILADDEWFQAWNKPALKRDEVESLMYNLEQKVAWEKR
jgi:hypothetical protein